MFALRQHQGHECGISTEDGCRLPIKAGLPTRVVHLRDAQNRGRRGGSVDSDRFGLVGSDADLTISWWDSRQGQAGVCGEDHRISCIVTWISQYAECRVIRRFDPGLVN